MSARLGGALAALLWVLLCLRWFDPAAPWRPAWLEHAPAWVLALPLLACLGVWLWPRGAEGERRASPGLWLVLGAALLFRLPMAMQGAAGYVTADGALSGLMALHVRDGVSHPVFVESVPYSGSLKAHLTAPLAAALDPARAFALVSVLFYVAFVGGLYRLAQAADPGDTFLPLAAGLYAAFAPPFVTRYSLSNDGNYVEVLALGTWALVLALRWIARGARGGTLALGMGILLGLAFWCHILAVIHAVTVAIVLLVADARRALRSAPLGLAGFGLGYLPGLLWNAAHGWESFAYLRPGAAVAGEGPGAGARLSGILTDHLPVLLGYDPGYPPAWDTLLRVLAALVTAAALWSVVQAARDAVRLRNAALAVLLVFTAIGLAVAFGVLPYIPGNPRYLLFLMASLPVFLARLLRTGWRTLLAAIVAFGALGSLAQLPGTARADAQWRSLARGLEAEGVRWCYTDFFLATKVNFLAEERVVCSAKLGPTTTEYFRRYREAVEAAPEAALIAVNATAAEKLERRLVRLGVTYERRDLMKPVLLRLSRKVDPQELFPDRDFPLR